MQINGANLSMLRGDEDSLIVSCKDGEAERPFVTGETVAFTARYAVDVDEPVISLRVSEFREGRAVFLFSSELTRGLVPMEYVYDVQLTTADGRTLTIIEPSVFELRGDVTP